MKGEKVRLGVDKKTCAIKLAPFFLQPQRTLILEKTAFCDVSKSKEIMLLRLFMRGNAF